MPEETTRLFDPSTAEPAVEDLRLLPWTTPNGHPCYLSTDGGGYLTTLADGTRALTDVEYRWLACRLTEALSDALRVADSRGQRILDPTDTAETDGPEEDAR